MDGWMKNLLTATFVALLMAGCGEKVQEEVRKKAVQEEAKDDPSVPAAIPCMACGKPVSKKTEKCLQCGHPTPDSVVAFKKGQELARIRAEEEIRLARIRAAEERKRAEEEEEQARMQAEEIKVLAERMKENFPVKQPFAVPSSGAEMLWVKPGAFEMGRFTPHTVTLTEGYWLGKHEVTQTQWEKVMGDNPSHFKGVNRPVEEVSWTEVTSFCEKLTKLEREAGRLPAGMAYQLPTEAEWEYACRAGTTTAYAFGDELTAKDANFDESVGETTDVGKYPANGWGFHDMHGNVWEWCADRFGNYPTVAVSDPVGPADGSSRVGRGGSWYDSANSARSAYRDGSVPAFSDRDLGFRLSLRPASK